MKIPFAEWLPDLADLDNPGSTVIKNVIPYNGSYLPVGSASVISDALTARCRGAFTARNSDGTVYSYAGDETKLYELSGNTHSDVTNVSGAYALSPEENWEFVKFGERVIATCINETPQKITFGGANFADLGGTPPKARHICVANNFIVLGNINDGTAYPQRVRWSGINNTETWTPNADTQADFQDLYSDSNEGGGWIMGLAGADQYFVAFQEYSIWRFTYSGSPLIFEKDEIQPGVGTPAKNSIIQDGRQIFFLGQDGFYKVIDGSGVQPIGTNKIDKYFFNDFNSTYPERVVGAKDPLNKVVAWAYPSTNSTTGTPDKIIFYDWYNDKWGNAEIDLDWIYSALAQPTNLEQLDAIYGNLDAIPVSLDSRSFKGGSLQLAIYDTAFKKVTLTGTSLSAVIETGEAQPFDGMRSHISGVRPLVDGSSTQTVQIGTRDLQTDSVTWSSAESVNPVTGIANFKSDARYQRIRVNTTGSFNNAIGVDLEAQPSGKK